MRGGQSPGVRTRLRNCSSTSASSSPSSERAVRTEYSVTSRGMCRRRSASPVTAPDDVPCGSRVVADEPSEHPGNAGHDSVEGVIISVVRAGEVQLPLAAKAVELLAGGEFVHEGKLEGLGKGIGRDEAVQAGGNLPAEPFGDVAHCRLGTPAQRPALANRGALPQQGEEHPGEPAPSLGYPYR